MVGKRFGRLVVLEETRKNGKKYYKCRCDCGTEKEIYYRSLLTGDSNSCGCLRRELGRNRINDLTGMVFGKLTVVGRDESKPGAYWWCNCECGNTKSIKGTSLTKKKEPTRGCGCEQRKIAVGIGTKTIAKNAERQISENMMYHTNFQVIGNKNLPKNNTSGHKGVWYDKARGLWVAYIQLHKKRVFLGRYATKEQAIAVREEAEVEYFEPLLKERMG